MGSGRNENVVISWLLLPSALKAIGTCPKIALANLLLSDVRVPLKMLLNINITNRSKGRSYSHQFNNLVTKILSHDQ